MDRLAWSVVGIAGFWLVNCSGAQAPAPPPPAPVGAQPAQPKVDEGAEMEADVKTFIEGLAAKVAPLEREMNLAYWEATTTGKQEAYDRAADLEVQIRKLFSVPKDYAFLKQAKERGKLKNPLLDRQVSMLRDFYEENQLDPALLSQMVKLAAEAEKAFNDFRGQIAGKPVADNDLYEILKREKKSAKRQAAWEAYQSKGTAVRDKLLELVKLRNQAARQLGYSNFYDMRVRLMEQDPDSLKAVFDDLATQSEVPYKEVMSEVNRELAKRYKIKPEAIRPWHFEDPFFQEAPTVRGVDLDPFFKDKDPREVVSAFYRGMGIDPSGILERSDLYEKTGKKPHAYCIDIDRSGDVRILANLRNNEKWTSTLLHEMGHAVYEKYLNMELPYFLRAPAHTFTTEAIAELFGRLTRNPVWLEKGLGVPRAKLEPMIDNIRFGLRLGMLVFARWTLVMVNFERELYANPDQDLNKLWWALKARYQLLTPPEGRDAPDWAAKIHFTSSPVYYHNYLLGEMMASQVLHHLAKDVLKIDDPRSIPFVGQSELGEYLKKNIFAPASSLRWDELLRAATGESLNPTHFVDQFLKE